MFLTLIKCAFGCKNKSPEDFDHGHTYYGDPICSWCAGMWDHDTGCCVRPKVSLVKNLSDWKYFRNDDEPPTEYELAWRRWRNGARVSAEWAYHLRNNDLHELSDFFQEQARRAR
ncbi:hypothetical protein [Streptomyces sp. WG5]|uniref:hypothetical protein n=1 Tax=Streptomyces sp. WG5 TaxID=3417648 RepID=UPI003CE6C979